MIEAVLAGVFGLLIGSFLNVCIHRMPRNRSVVKPRSHCVRCRKIIAWYDNVPVLSWVLLGGRCRHCKARISIRYPLVELLTGAVFFWAIWTRGATVAGLRLCVLCAMLIALAFSDLEKRILPDEFTLGGLLAGFAFAPFVRPGAFVHAVLEMAGIQWPETWLNLAEAAFGAVFLSGLLWSAGWIYEKVRHREGLGFGDVKLIAMIGSFLGITGALYTMVLGSVAGSVVGVVYIRATRQEMASYELPFGTFLAFVAMGVALFRWVIPGL